MLNNVSDIISPQKENNKKIIELFHARERSVISKD
jgi:hypothetical protein